MSVLFLAFLAAQALGPYPPVVMGSVDDGKPFQGGPYEGLSMGVVSLPDGRTVRGLHPSKPGSSPVNNPRDRAIVEAFIAGHLNPEREPLAPFWTKKSVIITCTKIGGPCSRTSPRPVTFGEPVTANVPYRRNEGIIRIEWLYGSALYYLTELQLRDGKIASVLTQPAWPPYEIGRKKR